MKSSRTPKLVKPGDLLSAASRGARGQRLGTDAELQSAAAELPGVGWQFGESFFWEIYDDSPAINKASIDHLFIIY